MSTQNPPTVVGFHEGELAVQRRAGVAAQAARLSGLLEPADLRGGMARFLADRTFAAVTSYDAGGRLWTSPLTGIAGFLQVTGETTLRIGAAPRPGDPLHLLPEGQSIGLVVVEFATRRRVRLNGRLVAAYDHELVLEAEQAYGNCPQYIQHRQPIPTGAPVTPASIRRGESLNPDDLAAIRHADTFFIGSTHPTRGNDASHRGGPAGFARIASDGSLWWPDYHGNNMFNTLGNLAVDPAAALLFTDFGAGVALHLSGTAEIHWAVAGQAGDDDRTGRRIRFAPEAIVTGVPLGLHASPAQPYHLNPPLTGPQEGQP